MTNTNGIKKMKKLRHIALLVETSREYGRGVLRGITRYNREHGPWSIYFRPQGLDDPPPQWLTTWQGDGVLVRVNNRQMAKAVLATGLPAIDLRGAMGDLGIPLMGVDNRKVAQMALSHLLDRGFERFGFCAVPRGGNRYDDQRCNYFMKLVDKAGFQCDLFQPPARRGKHSGWEHEQQCIARWIEQLKYPVAIMTPHDDRGLQVLDAIQRLGIRVPDDVAVISVDNDPHLCNLSMPELTSIDVNPERIGYEACLQLDRLMSGRKSPVKPKFYPPARVIVRQSTDVLAIDDDDIVRAVRYIRENACLGVTVDDVLNHIPLSRTILNRRFKALLGKTPKEEMNRVQMERARELLLETDLSVAAVATRCGFSDPNYFIKRFHEISKLTPRQLRLQSRR